MDVYLKYHEGDKSSYYYLGMIFNATDQLYNRDLNSGVNDFYKNIKIGGVIKTYIPLFKSPYPFFKEFSKNKITQLYDDCLMRRGNLYNTYNKSFYPSASDNLVGVRNCTDYSILPTIRYSMVFYSFEEDYCLCIIKDVPLKDLSLDKYKYDFVSWMIHRSIQELN